MIAEQMKAKNLSVEKLAQITGISDRYIHLLLESAVEKLPPAPYIRGYLFRIADALELNGDMLWKELSRQREDVRRSGTNDTLPTNHFQGKGHKKKVILIALIVLVAIIFAVLRASYQENPNLRFENLKEDGITTVREDAITLRGNIDPDFTLRIEGEQIFLDDEGGFTKEIILDEGMNIVVIRAKRLLGKEHAITKQIFYEKPRQEAIPAPPITTTPTRIGE